MIFSNCLRYFSTDFVSVNGKDVMVFAWSAEEKIYVKVFTFRMVEGF
jgi:hypothetical protein